VNDKGQSEVEWRRVANASSYNVRYCTGDPCTWSSLISATGTSTLIRDLNEETLYEIQVQAINISGTSGWSDTTYTLYTYPTRTPATQDDTVGIVPIDGFLVSSRYHFTICDTTSVRITDDWETQVENGMETWETATGRMVRVTNRSKADCNSATTNTVVRAAGEDMEMLGCSRTALGCANRDTTSEGRIDRTRIGLLHTLAETPRTPTGETKTGRTCTRLFQVAMHEAGHALGLGDHANSASVMFSSEPYCFPTAYDIVAVKAIYQSR
jgi:hypothetical protein